MRVMIGGALCLLVAVPARAGVVVQPGVPFTAAQLAAAISVRGGPDEGRLEITVSRLDSERLVLATPDGEWKIEIGAAGDGTAARIVALYVIEFAVGAEVARGPADVAATPAAAVAVAGSSGGGDRYRVVMLGVGSRGVQPDDFAWIGGAIEGTRAGSWIGGGGISWQHGLTIDRAPGKPISAELIRVRVVGGMAVGPVELVAGGFAGRVIVDAGTGVLSRWTTGLAAEARTVLPVSKAWAIEIAAGAELFRDRIEIQSGGQSIGATPRMALAGRIGLARTEARAR